jgi:hypothetical protein
MITAQDIRLAKPITLERLTGIPAPNFFNWSMSRIPTRRSINRIAVALNVSPEVVEKGFEMRKKDYWEAQEAHKKLDKLLAS